VRRSRGRPSRGDDPSPLDEVPPETTSSTIRGPKAATGDGDRCSGKAVIICGAQHNPFAYSSTLAVYPSMVSQARWIAVIFCW
jgi:hypothetical protein